MRGNDTSVATQSKQSTAMTRTAACCFLLLQFGGVDLDPETATLWFAGKQLQPDKKLSDFLGRHENTRAVVKLQKKGAGPPAREPVCTLASR
jgi:hypothetical protein